MTDVNLFWLPGQSTSRAAAARAYAAARRRVLPLHTVRGGVCTCRRADCKHPGKHPRSRQGVTDATTELAQIEEWWMQWPDANVGLAMGNGWICVDVDGAEHRQKLEAIHGPWPLTLRALTGRDGGEHWIYSVPLGFAFKNGKLGTRIDVKSDGGYIVAPPSLHLSGRHYRWLVATAPCAMPAWMMAALTRPATPPQPQQVLRRNQTASVAASQRHRYARAVLDRLAAEVAATAEGGRMVTLNKSWWRLGQFADVLDKDEARAILRAAAVAAGLPERAVDGVLK